MSDRNPSEADPFGAIAAEFLEAFRQGQEAEARKLATEAAARMKPLPADEKNPLAADSIPDDLILWRAYKEAKALIPFDAAPPPKVESDKK
jgi:hypothetical protein